MIIRDFEFLNASEKNLKNPDIPAEGMSILAVAEEKNAQSRNLGSLLLGAE